jgi:hypothetical protein
MEDKDPKSQPPAEHAPADPPAADPAPAAPAVSEADQALAARLDQAKTALTAREAELEEAKKTINAQTAKNAALQAENSAAVGAYRKLAVSANPIFTEELLAGSTIAEVDASMQRVAGLAEGIKTRLEAELKNTVIPAGAPERSGPDTSGLSPREKIKHGLKK